MTISSTDKTTAPPVPGSGSSLIVLPVTAPADGELGQSSETGGASTDGPAATNLTSNGSWVVGALGADGIAIAPADLSAAATTSNVAMDARDVLLVENTLLVADGIQGIKAFDLSSGTPAPAASSWLVVLTTSIARDAWWWQRITSNSVESNRAMHIDLMHGPK